MVKINKPIKKNTIDKIGVINNNYFNSLFTSHHINIYLNSFINFIYAININKPNDSNYIINNVFRRFDVKNNFVFNVINKVQFTIDKNNVIFDFYKNKSVNNLSHMYNYYGDNIDENKEFIDSGYIYQNYKNKLDFLIWNKFVNNSNQSVLFNNSTIYSNFLINKCFKKIFDISKELKYNNNLKKLFSKYNINNKYVNLYSNDYSLKLHLVNKIKEKSKEEIYNNLIREIQKNEKQISLRGKIELKEKISQIIENNIESRKKELYVYKNNITNKFESNLEQILQKSFEQNINIKDFYILNNRYNINDFLQKNKDFLIKKITENFIENNIFKNNVLNNEFINNLVQYGFKVNSDRYSKYQFVENKELISDINNIQFLNNVLYDALNYNFKGSQQNFNIKPHMLNQYNNLKLTNINNKLNNLAIDNKIYHKLYNIQPSINENNDFINDITKIKNVILNNVIKENIYKIKESKKIYNRYQYLDKVYSEKYYLEKENLLTNNFKNNIVLHSKNFRKMNKIFERRTHLNINKIFIDEVEYKKLENSYIKRLVFNNSKLKTKTVFEGFEYLNMVHKEQLLNLKQNNVNSRINSNENVNTFKYADSIKNENKTIIDENTPSSKNSFKNINNKFLENKIAEKVNKNIQDITDKVYNNLEKRLKAEQRRAGIF